MEENKSGGGGPPTEQLTREQVMAQRAEKKKLKEQRKMKSAAGGDAGGGDGSADPKPKKPQQKQPPKGKPGEQSKPSKPAEEAGKEVSAKGQPPQKPATSKKDSIKSPGPTSAAPAQGKKAKEPSPAPLKEANESKETSSVAISKTTSSASIPEDPKASDSKTALHPVGKSAEFQSTIQSLFKIQKKESAKDKGFSPHALFYNLGVKLRHNVIRGTNQRCTTLLSTIKEYVQFYKTPTGTTLKLGLTADLKSNLDALRRSCPFAIGMENAVEFLLTYLYKIEEGNKDSNQLKQEIMDVIDQYVQEKIEMGMQGIVFYGKEIIRSGDIIMIYSITEALLHLLETIANNKISFELIIIQTPETMLDMPILLRKLKDPCKKNSVSISSVNFSNAIYRIRHCTKLLIGGHGLFTTGGVMAQSGSGKLALLAATYNKPAVFLCETYKFCDRSPLDFFTLDEYMPEKSITEDDLFEPKIKYDVTPASLVTVVITDIDMLPSVSVPVVLRVQEGRAPRKDGEHAEAL